MKKMKKLFAVLLTLAMVMGLCMTTAAADDDPNKKPAKGTNEDKGTITVNGIDDSTVTSVKAYPIVVANYDSKNGNFIGFSNDWGLTDIQDPTLGELTNIANGKMANSNEAKALPNAETLVKVGNSYQKTDLAVGMYLILVEGADTHIYNPAVASINYVNSDGSFIIDSSKPLNMVADGNTWVKKSDQPDLGKTVRDTAIDENGTVTNGSVIDQNEVTGTQGNTANIGDQVTYDVTISPIPKYEGNYPKLKITDTLSTGLTYVDDSIAVFIVENGVVTKSLTGATQTEYDNMDVNMKKNVNYIYAASSISQDITVDFVVDGKYTLNGDAGKKALIEYRATVNDQAAMNSNGNKNKVVLEYSKNSNIDGDEGTDDKETHTYTFDIDGTVTGIDKTTTTQNVINKLGDITDTITADGVTTRTLLKDAKFGLFTDKNATVPYVNYVDGKDTPKTWDNIVTNENGQTFIEGLKAGTYYLKELAAPDGYSVNAHIFEIVIRANIDETSGLLTSWSVTIDGKKAASFTITNNGQTVVKELLPKTDDTVPDGFNIQNTKLSSLPSTGGIGTTIFTIGGCAIMIIAAALFFASRRKSTK